MNVREKIRNYMQLHADWVVEGIELEQVRVLLVDPLIKGYFHDCLVESAKTMLKIFGMQNEIMTRELKEIADEIVSNKKADC